MPCQNRNMSITDFRCHHVLRKVSDLHASDRAQNFSNTDKSRDHVLPEQAGNRFIGSCGTWSQSADALR